MAAKIIRSRAKLAPLRAWRSFKLAYKNISSVRWLLLGSVAGVFSGLLASAFYVGLEGCQFLLLHHFAGVATPAPAGEELFHGPLGASRPWLIPVMITAAALFMGYLVQRFVPEADTSGTDGTDSMIKAFHQNSGIIRPLVPLIRSSTAILTIATGGSAGREGPVSLLGAGLGSYFAMWLKLTAKERRILLLAGAAGGLGAIFRAPLGGALTAIEVIYREDFEAEAILPAVLSSVVAYTIFTFFFGTDPIFGIPHFEFREIREIPFYLLLALVCSAAAWFYVRTFYFIKYSVFARIKKKIGIMWTTGLGGLLMGITGYFFPQLLSGGYGWLEMSIEGQLTIGFLVFLVVGKTIATGLTMGSGMSGGMFAPALFVGGAAGGIVGQLGNMWRPDIVTQPGSYTLIGMAAFFAGAANAPIGPLIMVCEITQGYGLLAPLMLCSALCLVLCGNVSLYENQVDNKFDSPAHIDDATINILEQLKVEDVYKPGKVTLLEESITLKALTHIIADTNELCFPVKNHMGELTGILTVQNVRKWLFENHLFELVVVRDLVNPLVRITPDTDLYLALLKFVEADLSQIPVVDPEDSNKVLGMLNRENVFNAYSQTIKRLKEEEQ
ncbi:chloride channel protein [Desulfovibrio inopinatus]|uniref:chloride channel protein n=1 Tax=Desulfovibrio inopinatus TaxID=102109 RepID=UPI0003FA050A|nr:chloride channel protein [Desulfovibrio inopinatus]